MNRFFTRSLSINAHDFGVAPSFGDTESKSSTKTCELCLRRSVRTFFTSKVLTKGVI
jgi:hypothetical protein